MSSQLADENQSRWEKPKVTVVSEASYHRQLCLEGTTQRRRHTTWHHPHLDSSSCMIEGPPPNPGFPLYPPQPRALSLVLPRAISDWKSNGHVTGPLHQT
ncbi:hypothetical protein D5086_002306 [Populus alba]|uniref:Uncharacterized protein n=1 Tax=Populus alba TaxID=43335 RepID=A0ACC4D3E9_POPAL